MKELSKDVNDLIERYIRLVSKVLYKSIYSFKEVRIMLIYS